MTLTVHGRRRRGEPHRPRPDHVPDAVGPRRAHQRARRLERRPGQHRAGHAAPPRSTTSRHLLRLDAQRADATRPACCRGASRSTPTASSTPWSPAAPSPWTRAAAAGLPDVMNRKAFAGGTRGATTQAGFQAAIDALEGVDCNFVVPLVSRERGGRHHPGPDRLRLDLHHRLDQRLRAGALQQHVEDHRAQEPAGRRLEARHVRNWQDAAKTLAAARVNWRSRT
jgi:hypothetical protein